MDVDVMEKIEGKMNQFQNLHRYWIVKSVPLLEMFIKIKRKRTRGKIIKLITANFFHKWIPANGVA